jgi:[ribosomal protein S5]-alanine N-acetyltransferase
MPKEQDPWRDPMEESRAKAKGLGKISTSTGATAGLTPVLKAGGLSATGFAGDVMGFATEAKQRILQGGRVALRPLVPGDLEAWRALRARNHERINDRGEVTEQDFAVLLEALAVAGSIGASHSFGIFHAGELVGEITLLLDPVSPSGTVVAWIDEAHEGAGLVTESCVLMAQHAFDDLALHRFEATPRVDDVGVRRSLEHAGLRHEGTAVGYSFSGGRWNDHARYAFTSEEFDQVRDRLRETAGI